MTTKNEDVRSKSSRYLCGKALDTLLIDGCLQERSWMEAPRSPCFSDHTGKRPLFDTYASLVWDDRYLYVAFWLEDHDIQATQEINSLDVRQDSHVGVIFTGQGTYYDLAVNPFGAISEVFSIHKNTYKEDHRYRQAEFNLAARRPEVVGGGSGTNYDAMRWVFSDWRFSGLQFGVHLDGNPKRRNSIDKGWYVELAFPWEGFKCLSGVNQNYPPPTGELWKIALLRRQKINQRGQIWQATWTWKPIEYSNIRVPETNLELEFGT